MSDIKEHIDTEGKGQLRRHDFVVSVILWFISAFVFIDSWRMTFGISLPSIKTNTWLVAPGFLPFIISAGLLIILPIITVLSLHEGDFRNYFTKHAIIADITSRKNLTKLAHMALLCLFVFGLIGRINFGIASTVYLIAAMTLSRTAKLYHIIIISLIFSAAITYIFGTLMKIPLP